MDEIFSTMSWYAPAFLSRERRSWQ